MPGTVTEAKSTPWIVAEQFVEERMKLKQSNSRIALALRNAKIHRPSLYMSAKKSFNRALGRAAISTVGGNSTKAVSTKKAALTEWKKQHVSKTGKGTPRNASQSCTSDSVCKAIAAKLDSSNLGCSCQIASDIKSENPTGKTDGTKSATGKTVALKTVNVKPWENDFVKPTSVAEPLHSDVERERMIDRNIARLMTLLQECNERRHNDIGYYLSGRQNGDGTRSYQNDGDTMQTANQKLLKPGRIVYPDSSSPSVSNPLDNSYLSGVLTISSKIPSSPWCFHQLPPLDKVYKTSSIVERNFASYRLPAMKKDCNVCSDCRRTIEQISKQNNKDIPGEMESEHLKRLKYRLKLKERAFLEKELSHDSKKAPALRPQHGSLSSSEIEREHFQSSDKLGDRFSLPKLYLSHHSTILVNHKKERKPKKKIIDALRTMEKSSSVRKQPCYKLAKMDQMNSTNEKSTVNKKSLPLHSKTKEVGSAQKNERSQGFVARVDHPRVLMTPLRGFTPHWNEFPESPMMWRENTEVKEEETTKDSGEV